MIVRPGPVVDFLIENQKVNDPYSLDWAKVIIIQDIGFRVIICSFTMSNFSFHCLQAKKMLKNLRIQASPSNTEYKINGLSEKPCKEQLYVSFHSASPALHVHL